MKLNTIKVHKVLLCFNLNNSNSTINVSILRGLSLTKLTSLEGNKDENKFF